MSIFYLNHCIISSQKTVNSVKEKLDELISIQEHIKSKNAHLYIYSEFWNADLLDESISLNKFISEYYDTFTAITIIYPLVNSGPFYDSIIENINIVVSPEVEMLNFVKKLFDACISDKQQLIASLSCENELIHSEYDITLNSNENVKLKNYLGKNQIDTYFNEDILFYDIESVIIDLDSILKRTEIMSTAKKSAKRYNFQGRHNDIHRAISALENVELPLVIEGVNEEERNLCFYKSTGFEISKESVSTMSVTKYRRERKFVIDDGKTELFEWHIKVGRNIRIHYFVDKDKEKVYVGHCGKHLGTVSHNS